MIFEFVLLTFIFLLGTIVGSFIDVVSSRIASGNSFLLSRSQCEKCLREILPIDLIPLVSYMFLGGKCRFCKTTIPIRLFMVEFIAGTLFISAYFLTFTTLPSFIVLLCVISILVAIFISDFRFGIIPDQFLLALGILSFFSVFLQSNTLYQSVFLIGTHVFAGIVAFSFFFIVFLLTRGSGMGFGDVKFSFFIGLLLSFTLMIGAFYIAFLTGAVVSIILIISGKKRLKKDTIPFGPFLASGVLISLLFKQEVLFLVKIIFGI